MRNRSQAGGLQTRRSTWPSHLARVDHATACNMEPEGSIGTLDLPFSLDEISAELWLWNPSSAAVLPATNRPAAAIDAGILVTSGPSFATACFNFVSPDLYPGFILRSRSAQQYKSLLDQFVGIRLPLGRRRPVSLNYRPAGAPALRAPLVDVCETGVAREFHSESEASNGRDGNKWRPLFPKFSFLRSSLELQTVKLPEVAICLCPFR